MLLIEIEVGGDRPFRLLYTSDFCGHDQPGVAGALFPRTGDVFPIDVMVMEGVLATRKEYDEISYADEWARFQSWVAERRAASRKGALVAVATLSEATQVVTGLVEAGEVPVVHRMLQSVVDDQKGAEFGDESSCRRALGLGKVVVAPGEQLHKATPAGRLAGRSHAPIAVFNRVYKNSPAGKLTRGGRAERFLLGNHAPRGQLVGAVQAVGPAQVVLVHGHKSHLYSLKRAIEKAGYTGEVLVPQNEDPILVQLAR